MAFTAFQGSAYQRSSYQIIGGAAKPYTGGGSPYPYDYWDRVKEAVYDENKRLALLEKERLQTQENLLANEKALEELEFKRLKALADQEMQRELVALMLEIQRLEQQKAYLDGYIKWLRIQEDDCLVILLSLPFVN